VSTSTRGGPLRVVVLGHVDHGKSTLVGRLLQDAGALVEGRLDDLRAVSKRRGRGLELAFATDALQAERDQGITIDAAHVWLRTPTRTLQLVDAPGHEEFLRNMITGAASADAALLVIDAREGVQVQSRRHAALVRFLGLEQVVVALTKLDLVEWSESAARDVEGEVRTLLGASGLKATVVPVCAPEGTNVATTDGRPAWVQGPCLLGALVGLTARPGGSADGPLRLPVQDVLRVGDDRALLGRVESGVIRPGDELVFSPWNKAGFVKRLLAWPGPPLEEARAGACVGVVLDAPLFVERGQVASHPAGAPLETDQLEARLFWLGRQPLAPGREHRLRLATQEVACRLEAVRTLVDPATLEERTGDEVPRHTVAEVRLRLERPIAVDDPRVVPATGRFVLLDGPRIAGGGVVALERCRDRRPELLGLASPLVARPAAGVGRDERARRIGHRGGVVWLTGPPAAGKTTLALALERRLFDLGLLPCVLDGDALRHGLSADLGFSDEDRRENVRRAGEVAKLLADAGLVAIVALVSPFRADRERVRATLRQGELVEVHVRCPPETCASRDPKGLYRARREGRAGPIPGFDAPYEPPLAPELDLPTAELPVDECVARLVDRVRRLDG
jgi:bifunctional enzyme CysN/CysC